MQIWFLLYAIFSYTIGIVSLSWLLVLYFRDKNKNNLRLFGFIASMTISFMAFTLREFLPPQNGTSSTLPLISLLGAALTIVFFPLYTCGLKGTRFKSPVLTFFVVSGIFLFCMVLLGLIISSEIIQQLSTIATLGILCAAVIYSLISLNKKINREAAEKSPVNAVMKILFLLLTILLFVLDFMGGLNYLNPAFKRHFVIFPAFYAFLNLVLIRTNLKYLSQFNVNYSQDQLVPRQFKISPRENEVLQLLAKGKTYQEIADALFISLATVKSHVAHLFEKTGTHNKVELFNLFEKVNN